MNTILVKEPAVPSLPLKIGGGPGCENNVNKVEFKEWCQTEIDQAVKNLDWKVVAESNKKLVEGTTNYAKVLLCDLPGERDLFLLLWPPTVSTTIHGHPGDGCVHKLLEGELKETLYPQLGGEAKSSTIFPGAGSTFISNDIGYHKVENP
eukprot:158617_1